MSKVIVTRGLPASGKSTWAKEQVAKSPDKWVRINKDDMRAMLSDSIFIKGITESFVIDSRNAMLKTFLKQGVNVIIDDTNFAAQHIKQIAKISFEQGADVSVKDFDVPLEVCIERDQNREKSVGGKVIADMYKRYNLKRGFPKVDLGSHFVEFAEYVPDMTLPSAIVCDIDGTIAIHHNRSPYDETKVIDDFPNEKVIDVVTAMYMAGYKVVFLSGRHGSPQCKSDTIEWINHHFGWDVFPEEVHIYMRGETDNRKDSIIKNEIFDSQIAPRFNVEMVFDDRQQVLDMWQKKGVQTFNVSIGDNDF